MARPRDPDRACFLERTSRALSLPVGDVEGRLSRSLRSSVRLNPLRADVAATEAAARALGMALTAIPWAAHCFHFEGDKAALVASPLFQEGHLFLQNASSFVPPVVLAPERGQRILDVCAAPGGKSAHVAALVDNAASLHLNDALRADKLAEVTALLGVRSDSITRHPGQYIDKFVEGPFERVLLDAQCGGEGMIDLRHSQPFRFWSLARIKKYHHLQRSMLQAAWRLLSPGGLLVYSTCTFAPEENEAPLHHLLMHRPEAAVEAIDLPIPGRRPAVLRWDGESFNPSLAGALRLAPSDDFEGFFVCRIRKRG